MIDIKTKFTPNASAQKDIDKEVLDQLMKDGGTLVEYIKQEAPVKTGALRDSFDLESQNKAAVVFTDSTYATEVIFGTRTKSGNNFPQRAVEKLKK